MLFHWIFVVLCLEAHIYIIGESFFIVMRTSIICLKMDLSTLLEHIEKMTLSLTIVGQMKRLVNASKNLVLLMIKPKDNDEEEVIKGCDAKLQYDLYEVVNKYDDMFQEPKGLPPKRGIQHEIQLQQDCPLPNIDM